MARVPHLNLSGFPGAGKTTISKKLTELYSTILVPKFTTRPKRPTENGTEYMFISMKDFSLLKEQDSFIAVESNMVNGEEHYYAIPKVEHWPSLNGDTELILSSFGIYAKEVKKYVPEMKLCFVSFRDFSILEDRLYRRCKEDGSNFTEKMVVIERYLQEKLEDQYEYIIYNDGSIEDTIQQIEEIMAI